MPMFSRVALRFLPLIPRRLVRIAAGRYIAGESLEEMLGVVESIRRAGLLTTIDILGENVESPAAAEKAAAEYGRLIDALAGRKILEDISVKPTLVGLRVGEDLAARLLEGLLERAEPRGIHVTLDMEDVSTTDATLRLYRRLRERHEAVGVALQAYLERSLSDVSSLLPLRPTVRVCKGIYVEPPGTTLTDRRAIQESFLRLVDALLEGGGYPAIATHDPWLIDQCLARLDRAGRGPQGHEFQMLLGVGARWRPRIRAGGHRLRLYCPYGESWYSYSTRRLQENPHLFGTVLRSVLSPMSWVRRERF